MLGVQAGCRMGRVGWAPELRAKLARQLVSIERKVVREIRSDGVRSCGDVRKEGGDVRDGGAWGDARRVPKG